MGSSVPISPSVTTFYPTRRLECGLAETLDNQRGSSVTCRHYALSETLLNPPFGLRKRICNTFSHHAASPQPHHHHHAYFQERQSMFGYIPGREYIAYTCTDSARAQKGRQGWHPRAGQGQRSAGQGAEANLYCRPSYAKLACRPRTLLTNDPTAVPELSPRDRQHEQSPARSPRRQPRRNPMA